jgi:gliding motility-associated-like protein
LTIKVGASLIDSTFFIPFETCETEIKPLAPGIESWDRDTFVTIENALTNSDSKFALQSILITFYSNQDDAELRQNGIVFEDESDTYLMETPYLQDLWARVDNLDLNTISCLGIQKVASLKVNQLPEFERVDTNSIVCLNLDPITLEVASSDNRSYRYNWTKDGLDYPLNIAGEDAQVLVYEGGTYEVNATTTDGTACSKKIRMVLVSSEIATLTQDDLTVIDLEGDTGSVEINTLNLGVGDYEFALEDPFGPFQDDPYFENILPGIYKVYIQDKNGCGIAEIETSILGYMKFFSPNGDGINDFWKILGVSENFQPNSRVYVYDRNGKLLVDLDPLGVGWDGTYNGFQLPQDDYWFRVFFDNGKERIGHFSLLRPE